MYRRKGFVLNVIGNEALLPTYSQLKTHFLPLWIENGRPMGPHWPPSGHPVGAKWPLFTTKWVNLSGAILFHKITCTIIIICNEIVDRFTFELEMLFLYNILDTESN